jgi:uncharacterized membrane protein
MLLSRIAALALAGFVVSTAALAQQTLSAPSPSKDVQIAQSGRYLEVCNRSRDAISVATATSARQTNAQGQDLFLSKGWYNLAAGACQTIWENLENRWYYVYADSDSGTWTGSYPFCVSNSKFTYTLPQCGDGSNRRYFKRIDMEDYGGKSLTYYFDP